MGTQFEIQHSQIDSIASLLPRSGSNGQQLEYVCSGMVAMDVEGINQNGQHVEWGWHQVANGGLTWEWWWIGSVQVQWKDQAGKVHKNSHVSGRQQDSTYINHATCT